MPALISTQTSRPVEQDVIAIQEFLSDENVEVRVGKVFFVIPPALAGRKGTLLNIKSTDDPVSGECNVKVLVQQPDTLTVASESTAVRHSQEDGWTSEYEIDIDLPLRHIVRLEITSVTGDVFGLSASITVD